MNYRRTIILVILLLLVITPYDLCANKKSQEKVKVLFIGHSYLWYNDLPRMFELLAKHAGYDVNIGREIFSGMPLYDLLEKESTIVSIIENDWDYVVLLGSGLRIGYPDEYPKFPVHSTLRNFHRLITENNDSARMVYCMPWAFEDGMTWVNGWTDDYEDMQIKIYQNTLLLSEQIDFIIAPVGWAWNTVLKNKNFPLHYLHDPDMSHPSLRGSSLMACVIFSTIFQESCVNNTYRGGMASNELNEFKKVASDMVLDNLELWKIVSSSTGVEQLEPNNFILNQNFPNPFQTFTNINYEISENSFVEILIFDSSGRLCKKLVNEQKSPGSYSIRFDGRDFKSGTYYLRLKSGNYLLTNKLFLIK